MVKKNSFEKLWILLASVCSVTVSMMSASCGSKNGKGEVQAANTHVVVGIDVSEYQGMIEWDSLTIAKEVVDSCISEEDKVGLPEMLPVEFAIVRATKSSDYVDKQFQRNFKAARRLGICLGVYHFLTDSWKNCSPLVRSRPIGGLQKLQDNAILSTCSFLISINSCMTKILPPKE